MNKQFTEQSDLIDDIDNNLRLEILQDVVNGEHKKVKKLLSLNRNLINMKITETQDSLLHIAAKKGYMGICLQLLGLGHCVNPVNIYLKTPYDDTSSDRIKSILFKSRCNSLFANTCFERDIITETLSDRDYVIEYPEYRNYIFGITKCLESERNYKLKTVFREKTLMTAYYGELLVIHEHNQVQKYLSAIAKRKRNAEILHSRPISVDYFFDGRGESETRSQSSSRSVSPVIPVIPSNHANIHIDCDSADYLQSISVLLQRYPELHGYPSEQDQPEVQHAKKLIIFLLIMLEPPHNRNISSLEYLSLNKIKYCNALYNLKAEVAMEHNYEKNMAYISEISQIYRLNIHNSEDLISPAEKTYVT